MGRIADRMPFWANVRVQVFDASTPALEAAARRGAGRLLSETYQHNLVPTIGRNVQARVLGAGIPGVAAASPLTDFALGDDDTATTMADTALGNEIFREAISRGEATDESLIVQFYLSSGRLNGDYLREAALFAGDDLVARVVLGVDARIQPKTNGVAVAFSWELAYSQLGIDMTVRELGGNADAFVAPAVGDAYPAGAGLDKVVPGSGTAYIDMAYLPVGGTFVLEAHAKVAAAGARAKVALFNLDDAPNTVMAGSEITFSADQTVGERMRSAPITMPAAGVGKSLAVKSTTNNVAIGAAVWGCRVIRTS
jgi:hypothetical protein